MASSLHSKNKDPTGIPETGFICFATRAEDNSSRKRAKFEPRRLQEVNNVRKRGACLRCRLLKIPCSRDEPCLTCMSLAMATSSAVERKVLRWSDCIKAPLTALSIFIHALPPPENRYNIMLQQTVLGSTPVQLAFADQITWEVDAFAEESARWISDPGMTGISQVGAMSSPKFEQLVKPFVGEGPSRDFRCMIYAISLARTQQNSIRNHQFTVAELQTIGSLAGERCLHFLEKKLTPQSLASLSKNELQALFLMVVGTILAIGYAQPVAESIPFPSNQNDSTDANAPQTLYHAMQQHLCRTLAHYTVYLGTKLGLPIPRNMERFILDAAHSMWNKEGRFVWTPADEEGVAEEDDALLNDDYSRIDFDKWAFHLSEYYSTGEDFGSQHETQNPSDFHSTSDFASPSCADTSKARLETGIWSLPVCDIGFPPDINIQFLAYSPPLPLKVPQPFSFQRQSRAESVAEYCGYVPVETLWGCFAQASLPQNFFLV